jgi:hypothetical protein
MAQLTFQHDVPPIVERTLAQVRRGIRTYVWLEGLALVVITLVVAFWIGMLVDWLFEPAPVMRLAAMVAVGLLSLWVAYQYLFRRAFVPLPAASLAVLLERRFSQLNDDLLTTVDLAESDDDTTVYHPEMVARTHAAAAAATAKVNAKEVFRRGPLARRVFVAIVLAATLPVAALTASDVFGFWLKRLALGNELWPRRVHLEVVGFPADASGRRIQKVARDDKFELVVYADTHEYVAPRQVEFRFTSADGGRGRDTMTRVGEAVAGRDDNQEFRYEFNDVSSSMTLDVIGGDDRVNDLQLEIVARPELVGMEVECVYPDYLGRPSRRLPITGGMRIPAGTELTLYAASTKPLTDVRVASTSNPQPRSLDDDGSPLKKISWKYGKLQADDLLTIQATDSDGVTCREPYRISFAVIPDELPQVSVRLAGIGAAITPDAIVPLVGKVTDDYGIDRIWCAYQINDGPVRERPLAHQPNGEQQHSQLGAFDTRAADAPDGERAMELQPGQTLFLSVRATDRYNLSEAPRVGASQQFALDVVTVPQLLALLERRELELRQRFEAVIAKMTDTRNLLSRVEFPTGSEPEADAEKALTRRRLRVAGSLQNVTQSTHEVLGLADAFDDLFQQLENNRIDNVDLKMRLREQIGQPMRQLGEKSMAQLESQLQLVNERLSDPQEASGALADSLRRADGVLVQMQQILDRMLELESYNEVVGLLRDIIDDQQQLNDRTKQQQTDRIKDLFEEDTPSEESPSDE